MAQLKAKAGKRRRSKYSEKVQAGTHPYRYPFPTGKAYMEWRMKFVKDSPLDYESDEASLKPSRRRQRDVE
jgi:hypothetical protein